MVWTALVMQKIAMRCTKVGNEQPSKQPLGHRIGFLPGIESIFGLAKTIWWLFDGCFALQTVKNITGYGLDHF
jgi:hypothetical protein